MQTYITWREKIGKKAMDRWKPINQCEKGLMLKLKNFKNVQQRILRHQKRRATTSDRK